MNIYEKAKIFFLGAIFSAMVALIMLSSSAGRADVENISFCIADKSFYFFNHDTHDIVTYDADGLPISTYKVKKIGDKMEIYDMNGKLINGYIFNRK